MTETTSGASFGQAEKREAQKGETDIRLKRELDALITECVICKNEIKKGAKKCTRCNSFQYPVRRFLAGMDIKSLVALVPIVTLAFVFVQDHIVVHKSDLRIAIMDVDKDGVRIAVSNLGDRAAILHERAELLFVVNGLVDPRYRLLLKDPKVPGLPLIKPGESAVLDFLAVDNDRKKNQLDTCPQDGKECMYKVTFHAIAFDHEPQTVVKSYITRGKTQ